MTLVNLDVNLEQAVNQFGKVSVDDRLALLWFSYEKVGKAIRSAAPVAIFSQITQRLFTQVKHIRREEQLNAIRDLASGADTRVGQEYTSLNVNMKLAFWYKLAQGVQNGSIQRLPQTHELSQEAKPVLNALESMGFNEQVSFLQKAIFLMDDTTP
ncbi:MAG: orange carotenoid protein N-terminal domain-containing protein [Leptolyngbyaceae cyanobacterium MO_188.B28]|nr:orange carotenoid protein N-terminal domain-containing protein [Leptolyngbyaceae cyanobacterium MO_188.B28]